jgi:hypothetical protein
MFSGGDQEEEQGPPTEDDDDGDTRSVQDMEHVSVRLGEVAAPPNAAAVYTLDADETDAANATHTQDPPPPPPPPPPPAARVAALPCSELSPAAPPTPTLDVEVNSIRDFSMVVAHDVLATVYDEINQRWIVWPCQFAMDALVPCAYLLYGLVFSANDAPVLVSDADVEGRERDFISKVLFVYFRFVHEALIDPTAQSSPLGQKFARVLENINNMASMIKLHQRSMLVTNTAFNLGTVSTAVQGWANALSVGAPGEREETSFQKLLLFLLKRVYRLNLRKYNDKLYTQTMVDAPGVPPHRTHAWHVYSEIETFVYASVSKESDYDMWLNLTSAHTNVSAATNYLKLGRDFELPELVPDRHVFSFRNCVYNAESNTVFSYTDPDTAIPPSLVAAKFFNIDFPIELVDTRHDWRRIPTPKLDQILDHQKVPDVAYRPRRKVYSTNASGDRVYTEVEDTRAPEMSVKNWYYVFIGRMIYEIGEHDEWQVLLFIKGVAGSGKSTLGKIVSYLYDANDVGVLSNNIENKFGLAALVDKLIYVCYEVKHDFGLDQGEFQCMVSGEQMAIPKKFETATSVAWKTHGMFMGNEVAAWCDNSGSMSRRIVLGLFNEIVTDGNPKLFMELQEEMAHIILKSNRAYRDAALAFGMVDIWNVLPPYFSENRRKLRAETHALAFFLENCTDLFWDAKAYMSMDDLKLMMNVYLIADGSFKTQRKGFTSDFYQWVFEAYKIQVEADARDYKGEIRTTNFVNGVCDKNNKHFLP